jgi:hypothetical protein
VSGAARWRGSLAGLAVAAVWFAPSLAREATAAAVVGVGVPAVIAGVGGGWIVAPRAARAQGGRAAVAAILLMALTTLLVAVAAVTVVLVLSVLIEALTSGPANAQTTPIVVGSLVVGAPGIAAVGLLIVGPFVYLFLLMPAALWFLIVRLWTRNLRSCPF